MPWQLTVVAWFIKRLPSNETAADIDRFCTTDTWEQDGDTGNDSVDGYKAICKIKVLRQMLIFNSHIKVTTNLFASLGIKSADERK